MTAAMDAVRTSPRSSSSTSQPERSDICTSSRIKSGTCWRAISKPILPSIVVINRTFGRWTKSRSNRRTLLMLSSMYNTVAETSVFDSVRPDASPASAISIEVVARGNSSQNVEPAPGVLSTPIDDLEARHDCVTGDDCQALRDQRLDRHQLERDGDTARLDARDVKYLVDQF